MAQTQERYPYKLVRGVIARREGFEQKNAETGKRSIPFVHYQARSSENPTAKDELLLTEAEAAELNKNGRRVIRLVTGRAAPAKPEGPTTQTLEGLMALMVACRGQAAVAAMRQAIFDSGLLPTDKLSFKKSELVQLLQEAISKKNEGLMAASQVVEADRPE